MFTIRHWVGENITGKKKIFLIKQIIKHYIFLNYPAVCVALDAKCGYHCKIQRFFGACGTAESFDFVAEIGFVVGINYVFAVAEFHFANVDYIVAAHNYEVDLAAATTVFFVKPN